MKTQKLIILFLFFSLFTGANAQYYLEPDSAKVGIDIDITEVVDSARSDVQEEYIQEEANIISYKLEKGLKYDQKRTNLGDLYILPNYVSEIEQIRKSMKSIGYGNKTGYLITKDGKMVYISLLSEIFNVNNRMFAFIDSEDNKDIINDLKIGDHFTISNFDHFRFKQLEKLVEDKISANDWDKFEIYPIATSSGGISINGADVIMECSKISDIKSSPNENTSAILIEFINIWATAEQ